MPCQVCLTDWEDIEPHRITRCEALRHRLHVDCFRREAALQGVNIRIKSNGQIACRSEEDGPCQSGHLTLPYIQTLLDMEQETQLSKAQKILKRLTDDFDRDHLMRIVHENLGQLRCPYCHRLFVDWQNCAAVRCSDDQGGGCGGAFCGICIQRINRSTNFHGHVLDHEMTLHPSAAALQQCHIEVKRLWRIRFLRAIEPIPIQRRFTTIVHEQYPEFMIPEELLFQEAEPPQPVVQPQIPLAQPLGLLPEAQTAVKCLYFLS